MENDVHQRYCANHSKQSSNLLKCILKWSLGVCFMIIFIIAGPEFIPSKSLVRTNLILVSTSQQLPISLQFPKRISIIVQSLEFYVRKSVAGLAVAKSKSNIYRKYGPRPTNRSSCISCQIDLTTRIIVRFILI